MFGAGTTGRTTLGGLDPMPAELEPLVAKINQVGALGWAGGRAAVFGRSAEGGCAAPSGGRHECAALKPPRPCLPGPRVQVIAAGKAA